MHANRCVTGAGAARDNGHTGLAGQLAIGFRHMHRAGFKAAGHQLQAITNGIKAIQQVKIGFARHTKRMGYPLCHQRIGQQFTARTSRLNRFALSHSLNPS